MRTRRLGICSRLAIAILAFSTIARAAQADPIGAAYTVTNLGAGPITLSTAGGTTVPADLNGVFYGYYNGSYTSLTGGAPVVSVSNGQQSYAFGFTPDTVMTPTNGTINIPLAVAAPIYAGDTNGIPSNAYSYVTAAIMNANGLVAAVDGAGVYGHSGWGTAYTVQQNPNGSFGALTTMWSGSSQDNGGQYTTGGVRIVGMNNAGTVLGTSSDNYNAYAVVYNSTTHSLTSLINVMDAAGTIYDNVAPYAIDDQGRLLVQGTSWPSGARDTLLLTPVGLPVSEVPAPEPGSLAVMALAAAAFAAHRVRDRYRKR